MVFGFSRVSYADRGFPHYNILEETAQHSRIELGVPGFSMDNLQITREGAKLVVVGQGTDVTKTFTAKEFSLNRTSFRKEFPIDDKTVVDGADLKDGLLTVHLRRIDPVGGTEVIPINSPRQLLNESR